VFVAEDGEKGIRMKDDPIADAKARIEKLEAALEGSEHSRLLGEQKLAATQARIEKLEAALELIGQGESSWTAYGMQMVALRALGDRKARAALEEDS